MKICMLIGELSKSGAGANVYYIARNLADIKNDITIICSTVREIRSSELKGLRVIKIKSSKIPLYAVISYSKLANKYLNSLNENYDIIHTHGNYGYHTFKKHDLNSRYVCTNHGVLQALEEVYDTSTIRSKIAKYFMFPILKKMDFETHKKADKVIAVSKSLKGDVIKYLSVPSEKIEVIHNGISINEYELKEHRNKKITLFFSGRLTPQKGLFYLLESLRILKCSTNNFRLVISGSGILEQKFKDYVTTHNLTENVKFLGFISKERLIKQYSQSDIYILPSLYEPFGIVILEAMASGVPVIASNVGGIPEIVKNNKTGLLVPPRDSKALADSIITLIEDEKLRKKMGVAGRKRAEKYFNWKVIANNTLKMYKRTLSELV